MNIKNKLQRVLSLVLVLVLMTTLMSVSAFAAGTETLDFLPAGVIAESEPVYGTTGTIKGTSVTLYKSLDNGAEAIEVAVEAGTQIDLLTKYTFATDNGNLVFYRYDYWGSNEALNDAAISEYSGYVFIYSGSLVGGENEENNVVEDTTEPEEELVPDVNPAPEADPVPEAVPEETVTPDADDAITLDFLPAGLIAESESVSGTTAAINGTSVILYKSLDNGAEGIEVAVEEGTVIDLITKYTFASDNGNLVFYRYDYYGSNEALNDAAISEYSGYVFVYEGSLTVDGNDEPVIVDPTPEVEVTPEPTPEPEVETTPEVIPEPETPVVPEVEEEAITLDFLPAGLVAESEAIEGSTATVIGSSVVVYKSLDNGAEGIEIAVEEGAVIDLITKYTFTTDNGNLVFYRYDYYGTNEALNDAAISEYSGYVFVYAEGLNVQEVHKHAYTAAVTEATCTAGGYTTYTCNCGDSYIGNETAALGHSYTVAESDGYLVYTCDCGDSYAEEIQSVSYTKVSSAASGNDYVITLYSGSKYYALSHAGNKIGVERVTVSNGEITSEVSEDLVWNFSGSKLSYEDNGTTYYLYAQSSGSFWSRTTTLTLSSAKSSTVSFRNSQLKVGSSYLRYSGGSVSLNSRATTAYFFIEG